MSAIYVFLCYFLVIIMQFTMKIPFVDTVTIMGYTLRYFVFYIFILSMPFFKMLLLSGEEKRVSRRSLCVFFFVVFSILASIVAPGSFSQKMAEAVLFFMPLAICTVAENTACDRKQCIDLLLATNIVAAVVSFFVATGAIDVNIWAASGDLVRTAGAINSTLGVGGFTAALVMLFIDDENKESKTLLRKIFEVSGLLGSTLVVLFSLSRTRIVILLGLCVMLFVYNIIWKGTLKGNLKMLVFLIISFVLVFKLFPEISELLFSAIQGRYELGTDTNVDFRSWEMEMQLDMFKESPIIGKGWGIRSDTYVNGSQMYIHNMYTSLLMHTGIVGTLLFFGWYLGYFITLIKAFNANIFRKEVLIALMFFVSLTILGFTNSGVTQAGGYFMIFYIAALVRDVEKELKAKTVKVTEK